MEKLRIGVLGCANIAKRSVIPEIKKLDELYELVGVASRKIEKAEETATLFNTLAYGSYDELIDAEKVDAVYIPLPNSMHLEYTKKALLSGIHVLVEKSLACTYEEVKELVSIARKERLLLMENFQFRTHSQLTYLKELIDSKKLGELRALRATFCFPPFPDKQNIRYDESLGGGALLDAGAYTLKVSTLLLGNNLKVKAATLNHTDEFNVDIWGSAYLEDQNSGLSSSCVFGFDNYYQCGVEVLGTKGKVTTNRLFTARGDFEPVYELELNGKAKEVVKLPADNHFRNMLITFYNNSSDNQAKEKENIQNLIQAELIHAVNEKGRR